MNELKDKYNMLWTFFAGHYHQDVWEDFDADKEVWADFLGLISDKYKLIFYTELINAQRENEVDLLNFINLALNGGGMDFENSNELMKFLQELTLFTEKRLI